MSTEEGLVERLKQHYGAAARKAATGAPVIGQGCGATSGVACGPGDADVAEAFGAGRYDPAALAELPTEAVAGSIGCADPVALARLEPGEHVWKDAVFDEAHRVLRPGGRIAVADVVADRAPEPGRPADDAAWAACTAGAVTRDSYRSQLEGAGFRNVEVVDSHAVADGFWSVFVRATKPT